MPEPVSAISMAAPASPSLVAIVSQPPLGIASRAFRNRFRNTCWSLYSIPCTSSGVALSSFRTWMRPVRNWCSRSASTSLMTALTSTAELSVCAGRARLSRPFTILAAWIVRLGPLQEHLRKARDAGEGRVDFVRDPRREQANRRHLLRDLKLLLELHAGRNVFDDHNGAGDGAIGIPQRRRGDVDEEGPGAFVPRDERHAIEGRALGRFAPGRTKHLEEPGLEDLVETAGDRLLVADAVELLQPAVPPHDAIVAIHDRQTVVQRLENVLAELAHAFELVGLDGELPIEPAVFEGGRRLRRDRGQQRHVLAAERLAARLAAECHDGDGAFLRHARDEVMDPRFAPEVDFMRID